MRFQAVSQEEPVEIAGRTIRALPAKHTVPAVGYHLDSGNASPVFSGDTTTSEQLWQLINQIGNLRYLIIETAFSDEDRKLAILSKHLCPSLLGDELDKLDGSPEVFITHAKPGHTDVIMQEIGQLRGRHRASMLLNNQVFDL